MSDFIKYSNLTFDGIKDGSYNLIKSRYPDVFNEFSDNSVGSAFVDIIAGVGTNISMEIDRVVQETQRSNAQLRSSLIDIANNLGVKIPGRRPSVTLVDFTITVPVLGDAPDETYYPILMPGATISGGGRTFETTDVIDWKSPYSSMGNSNRKIIPKLNSNGVVVGYDVTKREIVINGSSKIYKRVITANDVVDFFKVTLPEYDVIGVDSVILVEGTNVTTNPTINEFYNEDNRYYEVDYLAEQKIFIEDNSGLDDDGIKAGKWKYIKKKFITEYNSNGLLTLTFGCGDPDVDMFKNTFMNNGIPNNFFINNYLHNTALGEKLKENYTLFIRYRVGGGANSNLGVNVLTQLGTFDLMLTGSRQNINQDIRRSLKVTNPIPAIGGNDGLSTEQIRELIGYNYSSQNRAIEINDYKWMTYKMPGKYGSPFKVNAFKENNKIVISILGIGSDSKLSNTSNSLMKTNISTYLSGIRSVNDYVEIRDGKIFNIGFDVYVYVSNISDNQIANNIIQVIRDYCNINNHEMGDDYFLGDIESKILNVNGVVNILDLKVYNFAGGEYSNNVTSQEIVDVNTGEIKKINNTIYSNKDSIFEIKFPEKDIKIYLKRKV